MNYTIVKKPVAEDGNLLYEIHDQQKKDICIAYCVFSKHPSDQWVNNNVVVSDIYVNHFYNNYEYDFKAMILFNVVKDVYAEGFTHIILTINGKQIKHNIRHLLHIITNKF